jgi:hypothetical protein
MMKPRLLALVVLAVLCLAAGALGREPSFEEHAAVQESLSRVHPRMRASWLKERGIEDSYCTCVRRPDSGQGLVEVGRWSYGPSYDVDGRVTASETLVALARGSGVSLLRFSRQDSLSIELLSDINAEGLMCRVKVADTLLFVGSRGGLEIYSIADEQNPVRLSLTAIPLNDFALQDSLVYTISGYWTGDGSDDSFRIYNISDPANPGFRGACRDSGYLVSVAGHTAYIGDRWGLYVLDVTDPANPHRIGSWGSAVEQVQARGRLCYVTTFNPNTPGDITFHVLDVSVPSLPYQIGSLDSAGGNDVFLVDTLAYGAGETDFNKLTVISVADSTRPRLVGSATTPGWSMGIWASGLAQASFVGCHWEGLQTYDTRNTSSPVCDTSLLGCDQAVDIYIDGGRAYVANEMAGLKILDISDPTRPTLLGSYDTTGQRPFMTSIAARDSFTFVEWSRPKFRTLDVTEPTNPVFAGTCELFNYQEDMVIRDSLVYCAELYRFQIVNVASPREPVLVGSCVLSATGRNIALRDTIAFVAMGSSGLVCVDVGDPTSPSIIGSWGGRSSGVSLVDTIAYVAGPYTGLVSLNVSDPASPRVIDSLYLSDTLWWNDVRASDSRVYVGGERVLTVDASDPANLLVRGTVSPPYLVQRLAYSPPYLYAACLEAGVSVYESTAVGVVDRASRSLSAADLLKVEPNPVRSVVTVVGLNDKSGVSVFDAAGRDVSKRVRLTRDAGLVRLGIDRLPKGLYFVCEAGKEVRNVVKFVKQ